MKQQAICCIIMNTIKKWIWNNIIDTKYGFHDYVMNDLDDIDIDQLISDRGDARSEGVQECYDY